MTVRPAAANAAVSRDATADQIKKAYRERAKAERWPVEWMKLLKGEFDTFAAQQIAQVDDDDDFPGDRPSIRDLPESAQNYMAG